MRCSIDGMIRNLPDFLIVGAAKSGTTALHAYLAQHPAVLMPQAKETHFFHLATNSNRAHLRYAPESIQQFDDYLQVFEQAQADQICGEACPSYLYFHEHAIPNIQRFHPRWRDLKIIIILREPVDKIVSHYFFVKNTIGSCDAELQRETIEESLALEPQRIDNPDVLVDLLYVENTRYPRQVQAYLEAFPHVKLFLYDDLRDRPQELYAQLCEFLGIHGDANFDMAVRHNEGSRRLVAKGQFGRLITALTAASWTRSVRASLPKSLKDWLWAAAVAREDVSLTTRNRLKEYFRKDVGELRRLTQLDLTRWGYE